MKKIKSISGSQYTSVHINEWCKKHNKDYLRDENDLEYQTLRHKKYIGNAIFAASIFSFLILVLLLGFMYKTETIDNESIVATLILSSIIWTIARVYIGNPGKNKEVFDSIHQLHREWNHFQKLDRDIKANSVHLRQLGYNINKAERQKDEKTKKKLMRQFRRDHKVLYNFGIVKSENYGDFIPKISTTF